MKNLQKALNGYQAVSIFLVLVILVTVIFGSIYGAVQQSYRTNANDPQVEVVGQVADVIRQGVPLDAIVSDAQQVDMAQSLSLFVIIFDKDKKLAGSSVVLNGQAPTPPSGTFDVAAKKGEDRFTWEPAKGVRIAAVLKQVDDKGFVLAGRSLKEIEIRESNLTKELAIGWAISILLVMFLSVLVKPRQSIAIIEETNVTLTDTPEDQVAIISESDQE